MINFICPLFDQRLVVGDKNHRQPLLLHLLAQVSHDGIHRFCILPVGRLVQEQQLLPARQHRKHCQTALLPLAEHIRRIFPLPFQTVALQQFLRLAAAGILRQVRLPEPQPDADLVLDILGHKLVGRVLEHNADLAVQLPRLALGNILPLQQDLPAVRVLL